MIRPIAIAGMLAFTLMTDCTTHQKKHDVTADKEHKIVIYQVFTRLFGNTVTNNKPWGTIEENGVGKFHDFTPEALAAIKELGVTHIWYTGVLHHAMVTDYSMHGLPGDDPDVVKGRAGSPYAIKDYYNVNPDLAEDPAMRLEEFTALIQRTHDQGLKVIIDIVPNHVARTYHSVSNPEGVEDFGASDDKSVEYRRDNNFYYIPGKPFRVPEWRDGYSVLGEESHPLADGFFNEQPAKWTGNGSRAPQPDMYDWYETVKINFGIRPDGTRDFDALPEGFDQEPCETHFNFWKGKDVPDSWKKFRDIAFYWLDKGVDGFRYDMAQMVPVEFWSYLNSAIKMKKPDAILVSEIYVPEMYRDYIRLGKMDYLYDKVQMYDTLKNIIQGRGSTDNLTGILEDLADIEHHMLHFLENHDEQRIASPEFAGDARKGLPAMVVSAAIGSAPVMVYFGQHVGEPGAEQAGFGTPSRTSIFDYIGVPHHQRWMNYGKFDGGALTEEEKALHDFYCRLLNFVVASKALTGEYGDLHTYNRNQTEGYPDRVFSFARWKDDQRLLVVTNFDDRKGYQFNLHLTPGILEAWELPGNGTYSMKDLFSGKMIELKASKGSAHAHIDLEPLESLILIQ